MWSFPNRGKWATHQSNYRGNWAPQIPRNLIIRYSRPKEIVLDQMCGSGTTLIECKLLDRNGIGVDINSNAIMITRNLLNFNYKCLDYENTSFQKTFVGDARKLEAIKNDSIDLIATHPPYADIISYSSKEQKIVGDISCLHSLQDYLNAIQEVASESYRVLKPNRYCAILFGDSRKRRHHIPIAFMAMERFLRVGFILREDIIKCQWKTKQTRERWAGLANSTADNWVGLDKLKAKGRYTDFFLLAHEHLFVFRKPDIAENPTDFLLSAKRQSVV